MILSSEFLSIAKQKWQTKNANTKIANKQITKQKIAPKTIGQEEISPQTKRYQNKIPKHMTVEDYPPGPVKNCQNKDCQTTYSRRLC